MKKRKSIHEKVSQCMANQHDWADSFGRVCHIDLAFVSNHLRHVRQCTTVIQMKMTTERNTC